MLYLTRDRVLALIDHHAFFLTPTPGDSDPRHQLSKREIKRSSTQTVGIPYRMRSIPPGAAEMKLLPRAVENTVCRSSLITDCSRSTSERVSCRLFRRTSQQNG
jgi:hypothetical protein